MNEAKQKFRLTGLERAWILYDVGNSAFVLLVATLIPIFFNALAEGGGLSSVEYLAYWGYAASAVTVITAVLSPILGTLADTRNYKKPIFTFCVAVGDRLLRHGDGKHLAAVPAHLHLCQGGLFGQSGVL